jgi:hypothetical protein
LKIQTNPADLSNYKVKYDEQIEKYTRLWLLRSIKQFYRFTVLYLHRSEKNGRKPEVINKCRSMKQHTKCSYKIMSITLTCSSLTCLLTLYFFVVVSGIGFAQNQANVWHFGDGRCLDFSSGVPVNLPGSQISTFEGCASYSDQFGDFLF